MTYAEYNIQLKNDYWSELLPLRNRVQRLESMYRGGQYSRKEKKQLKAYGLIPLAVNICKPLISQRRAILTSSKPSLKVVPLQGAEKEVADAAQQFVIGKWNADYVDIHLNRCLRDCLIGGFGFMFVDLASFLDNSTFDINVSYLDWRYVLPDPNAERFDLSDAENIIIRKIIGVKRAQVLYGLKESEIDASLYQDLRGNNLTESTKQVEVLDRFSKYPVDRWSVTPLAGEHLRDLPTVFYTSDLEDKINQENRDLAENMKKLKVDGKIELKNMRELHIYRGISIGQRCVYEGMMNIVDYPVVPFINEYASRFAEVQGDIEPIEGVQKALNKFYVLTMHNAMLTGNFRVMGPKNAIKDKAKFQRSWAIPGAYIDYEPDANLPNGGAPQIIQPGTLPSAFFALSGDLIEKAKFLTSVYSPMLGDPHGTPETFSTAATLQNLGTQTIKELARRVEVQIAKIGEVMIQFMQNYTKEDELLQFIDMESGEITSPMSQEVMDGGQKSAPQPIKLNQVITKEGVVHELKNNTRLGKYAVKVLSQPNLGTDRLAKASFLQQMIMNKAIPPTPAVIRMLADLMEIPGGKKLIEDMKAESDAGEKLQQLSGQMEQMGKAMKTLQDENMTLAKKLEISDFRGELEEGARELREKGKDKLRDLETAVDKLNNSGNNSTKEE